MQTQLHRRNAIYGLIAAAGIVQFVACVAAAIANYPEAYSLAANFLSDLGRSATWQGLDNRTSATVFNRSIVCLGAALILFFLVMPASLPGLKWTLRTLGVMSAAGLIGIGLTPYDQHERAHIVSLGLWLGPLVLMVVSYLALSVVEGLVTWALAAGSAALLAAAGLYLAVAHARDQATFLQKVVIVLAAAWFVALLTSVSVETVRSLSSRREIADRQAREYLQLMGRRLPRRNH